MAAGNSFLGFPVRLDDRVPINEVRIGFDEAATLLNLEWDARTGTWRAKP